MNWDQERQIQRLTRAAHAIEKERQITESGGDPTVGFFAAFLVAHVLVWTILASLTQPNLPESTLQLLTAGQSPAWGYFDHPPLAVWLMSFVSIIFAPAAWPAYLLAQICIGVCLWSAWRIGKDFLHPWTSICGVIVLEGCYFFTIGSTAFTSAHLAGCFWALAILTLYHGFQLERRLDWVLVGICLGLGMLSHYSTALLFIAMLAFSFLNHQARRCWDTSWPFLAGAIAAVIVLPHFWWAWSHQFTTVSVAVKGMGTAASHGEFTIKFLVTQLLAVVPVLLLLIPIITYFRLDEPVSAEDEERDFVRQYLLVVTVLPAALMLAFALLVGVNLGSTGLTLWTFTGVLLLLWSDLDENRIAWRKIILHSGAVGGGFAALLVVMNFMVPQIFASQSPDDIHFPGRKLAAEVRAVWEERGFEDRLSVIAGPSQLAQNASWYHGRLQRPFAYVDLDEDKSVGASDALLREKGGIILWTDNSDVENLYSQEALSLRMMTEDEAAHVEILPEPISLKWSRSSKAEPLVVHVAIVYPAHHGHPTEEAVPVIETTRSAQIERPQSGNAPSAQPELLGRDAFPIQPLVGSQPQAFPSQANGTSPQREFPVPATADNPPMSSLSAPTRTAQPQAEETLDILPDFSLMPQSGVQPTNFTR